MEEYIVSARKYRPATFDTVVGQRALTTTLLNAIRTGKLAHAYLFCGPRGVGKTTCARIFAKTINCLSPTPAGEACCTCESCRAFDEQRSMNIHELDAASNNSVDDIRELIDKVQVPPQTGKYKVFIIDEVHMLSASAFNAFLKTLEEPPSYVIFILATTEKHKILPTILSRCQVYDFARMTIQNTIDHLAYVAQKEGYTAEPQALNLIAEKADGGMRDALSIFDQLVSFTGGNITYQSVLDNLNVLDSEYYFRLTEHLIQGEIEPALLLLNEVLNKGFDGGNFIAGLAAHFRNLMVAHDTQTLPLLETGEQNKQRYQQQAQKCKAQFLYRAIKLCNDCDNNYRQSRNKRLQVELCLIQTAQLNQDDSPSSGRQPGIVLKPIFTQSAARVAVATAPKSAPVATQRPTKKTTAPAVNPADRQLPKSQTPQGVSAQNKKLELNSVSIFQKPTAASEQASSGMTMKNVLVSKAEQGKLSDAILLQCWQTFAHQLPKEQIAIGNHMKGITPKVVTNDTFRITLGSDLSRKSFLEIKKDIEHFVAQSVGLPEVHLDIVLEKMEVQSFNKREILKNLMDENINLKKLVNNLQLELE